MANKNTYYQQKGLSLIDGTEQVIKDLYAQGYPLALVTSDSQENMLEDFSVTQAELLSYFSVVVTLDDVNEPKPNPEPYARASTLLGVEAENLLVLEDSDVGAIAASDAGANVLLYRPNGVADETIKQKVLNIITHPRQLMDYIS